MAQAKADKLLGRHITYKRRRGIRPPMETGPLTAAVVVDEVRGHHYHYLRVITSEHIVRAAWRPFPVDVRDIQVEEIRPASHHFISAYWPKR